MDIFGDRFYIEVMRHGMPEEDVINTGLVKVARELSLPIVATNDSHYLDQKDAPAHDVLLCIGTGKTVSDTSRMKFYSDQFYVKSRARDGRSVARPPRSRRKHGRRSPIASTSGFPRRSSTCPNIPCRRTDASELGSPKSSSRDEYLREICEQGLLERYGAGAR